MNYDQLLFSELRLVSVSLEDAALTEEVDTMALPKAKAPEGKTFAGYFFFDEKGEAVARLTDEEGKIVLDTRNICPNEGVYRL